ncbi:MAG TPA: gluconokinase [Flavisolibacter sp.]
MLHFIMIIVVMGVTGTGKTTIGKKLAEHLSIPFIEGDEYHDQASIMKMQKGIPLQDEDRYPWLRTLSGLLQMEEGREGAVLACSALKEEYRQILQQPLKQKLKWIYLEGDEQLLRERMKNRPGHFMPAVLLRSQLDTIEKPTYAQSFSVHRDPAIIVKEIMSCLHHPGD